MKRNALEMPGSRNRLKSVNPSGIRKRKISAMGPPTDFWLVGETGPYQFDPEVLFEPRVASIGYLFRSGEVHQTTKNAKIAATRPKKIDPKKGPIPACPSVELRMEYIPHVKDTFHATQATTTAADTTSADLGNSFIGELYARCFPVLSLTRVKNGVSGNDPSCSPLPTTPAMLGELQP